jgi:hypothetical protein|tara:strand:- start:111 stop:473 length:363 start_codon:yes stop_codon:yes gene_type:complete
MAVINEYKFYGNTSTTAETVNMFGTDSGGNQLPLISETYIIKSLHVTNKSASNTPTITITNNSHEVIHTQTLAVAASVEILTNPMVVEGNTILKYTTIGTVTDGVVVTVSYLNIKKEVTT